MRKLSIFVYANCALRSPNYDMNHVNIGNEIEVNVKREIKKLNF